MIKFNPSWFMFFMLIILGFSMVISSDNWFMAWMGFELSLLGFIPMFSGNSLLVEGMVKYFLVQAGGSAMFLFSFFVDNETIFILSMFMKLGVFPFFQWVPLVMGSLSWLGCLILVTVQKLSPLVLILSASPLMSTVVAIMGTASILASGILGFNQSNLRHLMGYSSISHSGWVLCSSVLSMKLTIFYFLLYCYLTSILFFIFEKKSFVMVAGGEQYGKFLMWVNMLLICIAGLPPFSMFFLKALILMGMSKFIMLGYMMLLGAALSVFYYLNFIIPSFSNFWESSMSGYGYMTMLGCLLMPLVMLL